MGLQKAKFRAKELIDTALEELRIFGKKGEPLAALGRYIIERKR
jgi:hypothetical protein